MSNSEPSAAVLQGIPCIGGLYKVSIRMEITVCSRFAAIHPYQATRTYNRRTTDLPAGSKPSPRKPLPPQSRNGSGDSYCMAMVASVREDAPPIVTTSETAFPVGAFAGISTLICTSPL